MPHDSFSPAQTAEAVVAGAIARTKQNQAIIFFKAFNAGIFLSLGATVSTIVAGGSSGLNASNPGLVKVIAAALSLPLGLMMIVLNAQELVTGNMLTMPMAAFAGRIKWYWVPLNIAIVFFGNLVGSLFYDALLVRYSEIQAATPYAAYAITFARTKVVTPGWGEIFLRGIGCNILVCLAVWQATAAREVASKIMAIWFPVFIFVLLGYDHVVANMYFIPIALMYGADFGTGYYIWKSMIPSFIGNQVGALMLAIPFYFFYLHRFGSVDAGKAPTDVEAGHAGPRDQTAGGAPDMSNGGHKENGYGLGSNGKRKQSFETAVVREAPRTGTHTPVEAA